MRRRLATLAAVCALSLAAWPVLAQKPERFIVFFEVWSAQIDPAGQEVVKAAIAHAIANPSLPIEVVGFADPAGGREANLYLSLVRAQRIFDELIAAGIAPDRASRIGEGSVSFVGSPQEARRVEILVGKP